MERVLALRTGPYINTVNPLNIYHHIPTNSCRRKSLLTVCIGAFARLSADFRIEGCCRGNFIHCRPGFAGNPRNCPGPNPCRRNCSGVGGLARPRVCRQKFLLTDLLHSSTYMLALLRAVDILALTKGFAEACAGILHACARLTEQLVAT